MKQGKIHYRYPVYPQLSTPNGPLPRDAGAQACFFFYMSAEKMRELVGGGASTQIILDDELWMDTHYENLAWSVATMYGLSDPSDFERYWSAVEEVCVLMGWAKPHDSYTRSIRKPLTS